MDPLRPLWVSAWRLLLRALLVAVLLGMAIPFGPVQIIVMELFMDLGASVTFVAEPAEEDVMATAAAAGLGAVHGSRDDVRHRRRRAVARVRGAGGLRARPGTGSIRR